MKNDKVIFDMSPRTSDDYDRIGSIHARRFVAAPATITFAGIPVVLDPTMPDDAIDIVTQSGKRFRFAAPKSTP